MAATIARSHVMMLGRSTLGASCVPNHICRKQRNYNSSYSLVSTTGNFTWTPAAAVTYVSSAYITWLTSVVRHRRYFSDIPPHNSSNSDKEEGSEQPLHDHDGGTEKKKDELYLKLTQENKELRRRMSAGSRRETSTMLDYMPTPASQRPCWKLPMIWIGHYPPFPSIREANHRTRHHHHRWSRASKWRTVTYTRYSPSSASSSSARLTKLLIPTSTTRCMKCPTRRSPLGPSHRLSRWAISCRTESYVQLRSAPLSTLLELTEHWCLLQW